jgi:hypothetical protein
MEGYHPMLHKDCLFLIYGSNMSRISNLDILLQKDIIVIKVHFGYSNPNDTEGIVSCPRHQYPAFLNTYVSEKEKFRIGT